MACGLGVVESRANAMDCEPRAPRLFGALMTKLGKGVLSLIAPARPKMHSQFRRVLRIPLTVFALLVFVADGEITEVVEGIQDNTPRTLPPVALDTIAGNHVILKIAPTAT